MADEPIKPEPLPIVEKTTATQETTKTVGAPTQPPPPAVIADDNSRKWLAVAVIVQFLLLVGYMMYSNTKLDNTQLILGAEVSFVTTVLNYYFGSSSGSTAKSAVLDKK